MRLFRQLPPWVWLVLCAVYILSPVDFLPDVLGLPGRIDDLLVAFGTLAYLYSASKKTPRADRSRNSGASEPGRQRGQNRSTSEGAFSGRASPVSEDPYEVLGVSRDEELTEITRRYKEKLLQYHPDRVQHLGKEFQEMAEQRTKEITEAYQHILRTRGKRS